jgi:hypothetical protein
MNVLQQYMIEKAKILGELGTYVTDDDIDELGSWSDSEIENTALAMIDGIQQVQSEIVGKQQSGSVTGPVALRIRLSLISSALCPWCHFNNDPEYEEFTEQDPSVLVMDCNDCSYACRHLRCSRSDSNWDTIYLAVLTASIKKSPDVPTRKDIKRLYGILKPQRKA